MNKFEAKYSIGQKVEVCLEPSRDKCVEGYIRAVTFTNCKVRYSIQLEELNTTIHNIDSVLVVRGLGVYKTLEADNYS